MRGSRNKLLVVALVAPVGLLMPGCRPAFRSVSAPLPPLDPALRPTAAEFLRHVRILADPVQGGRMTCTPGAAAARGYIVGEFSALGLLPVGQTDSWFQAFPVKDMCCPGEGSFLRPANGPALALDRDFWPMASGREGEFAGRVVFVGFGYRMLPNYDDYADVDVRGSVVMMMQGTPRGTGRKSLWWGKGASMRDALFESKLRRTAAKGAAAVLVVSPPDAPKGPDPLASVIGKGRGKLPAMRISRELADRLLSTAAEERTIADLAAAIRPSKRAASFALPVRLEGRVQLAAAQAQNVIGVLPSPRGKDAPVLVIGTHYDHLPAGGHKARDRGIGVRPGADDNASGVSALLLVAKAARDWKERSCTWVFVAFDCEEFGFRGSRYYAEHPLYPLHRTAAMINLDQVGRMRRQKVYIIGNVRRRPMREAIAVAAAAGPDLQVRTIPIVQRSRWSDQAAFARRGVPTLFFYTGRTRDYHRMTDTADRVNAAGGARVAALAFDVLRALDMAFGPAETAPTASGTARSRPPSRPRQ